MSTESITPMPHFDELDLIRIVDGEGSREERERWEEHLLECWPCRDRVDDLRRDSDLVAHWLGVADEEPAAPVRVVAGGRGAGRGRGTFAWRRAGEGPWLKAAVLVLVLAAPLAAFPGVREWVVERVVGAGTVVPAASVATRAAGEDDASPSRIRFVPDAGAFSVTLDVTQAAGALTVGRAPDGAEAVFQVSGPGPWPEPVISARGILIGNDEASVASYGVLLPPEVGSVTVTIGGSVVRLDAADLDGGAVVALDGGAGRR